VDDLQDSDPPQLSTTCRRVFAAFRVLDAEHGVPPTIDEVASWLALSRTTVFEHRRLLKDLGLLDYDNRKRSTRITSDAALLDRYGLGLPPPVSQPPKAPDAPQNRLVKPGTGGKYAGWRRRTGDLGAQGDLFWPLPTTPPQRLPIVGSIAAGRMTAFQGLDPSDETRDVLEVEAQLAAPGRYALRVSGDSLVDLGILDGDHLIVDPNQPCRKGDLVVVLLPSEDSGDDLATVKIFSPDESRRWLVAANSTYPPMLIAEAGVLGRVTAVVRRF
jgi:SOS-response transcriptional repressor LexA